MGEESKQDQTPPPADEGNKGAPPEEKKGEQPPPPAEEQKEAEQPPPPSPSPPFVLYVNLHCVGCAKKIERSIMKLRGVESIVIDMAQNQVTIKGVVEPQAVCDMIKKKTKRMAKVLSPMPAADGDPLPQVVASQVSGLVTVELNVNMHCEACAEQLKKKILKMRGVQSAETEFSSGKVTVTGTMDADKLVDYVYRRTKKQARIVPQPEPEKPPEDPKPAEEAKEPEKPTKDPGPVEEKKEENADGGAPPPLPPEEAKKEEGGSNGEGKEVEMLPVFPVEEEPMKRMMYYYQPPYVIERLPPPQLFSDENPNACCIS